MDRVESKPLAGMQKLAEAEVKVRQLSESPTRVVIKETPEQLLEMKRLYGGGRYLGQPKY